VHRRDANAVHAFNARLNNRAAERKPVERVGGIDAA